MNLLVNYLMINSIVICPSGHRRRVRERERRWLAEFSTFYHFIIPLLPLIPTNYSFERQCCWGATLLESYYLTPSLHLPFHPHPQVHLINSQFSTLFSHLVLFFFCWHSVKLSICGQKKENKKKKKKRQNGNEQKFFSLHLLLRPLSPSFQLLFLITIRVS